MNPIRREKIFFAAEENFHSHFGFGHFPQFLIRKNIADAGQKKFFFVRCDDKIVCAAFHAANNVLRVRERRQQDNRNLFQRVVRLDVLTEFVPIHLRHGDGADDHCRSVSANGVKRVFAIIFNAYVITAAF